MAIPKPGEKKDSTSEVPMYDLGEIIRFASTIQEKGLETAAMPVVAAGNGYKAATSTPFYRRMVAARLFGLLSKTGAELTPRAKDYLKPDFHGAEKKALYDAITAIPRYAELISKFSTKKLNVELVANGLSKDLCLTDACAMICAKAFEASLKFAGLLSVDLTVSANPSLASKPLADSIIPKDENAKDEEPDNEEVFESESETQSHVLYLDKTKKRKILIKAPLNISPSELKRVKGWLDYALIVDSETMGQDES